MSLSRQLQAHIETIHAAILAYPREEQPRIGAEVVGLLVERLLGGVGQEPPPVAHVSKPRQAVSFVDDNLLAAYDDYCDGIILTTKRDKLAATAAFLETALRDPISIRHHVVPCFRHRRWSGNEDDLLRTVWDINGKTKGFFESIENGGNLVLSAEGREYVAALPRRKRRK